jgi:hypothetical protein
MLKSCLLDRKNPDTVFILILITIFIEGRGAGLEQEINLGMTLCNLFTFDNTTPTIAGH